MDAKPIALFFACSDNQIRQAALTVPQLKQDTQLTLQEWAAILQGSFDYRGRTFTL
jgi:hypothetical protein